MINGRWLLTFSVCSPDCAIFLFCFVLGCRLKHTQELYNVRSCQGKVFNLVGIQSFGFECSLKSSLKCGFALWQKKKKHLLDSVQFVL